MTSQNQPRDPKTKQWVPKPGAGMKTPSTGIDAKPVAVNEALPTPQPTVSASRTGEETKRGMLTNFGRTPATGSAATSEAFTEFDDCLYTKGLEVTRLTSRNGTEQIMVISPNSRHGAVRVAYHPGAETYTLDFTYVIGNEFMGNHPDQDDEEIDEQLTYARDEVDEAADKARDIAINGYTED